MNTKSILLVAAFAMCQLSYGQTAEQNVVVPSFPALSDSSILNVNAPARARTDVHIKGTYAPLYVHRTGSPMDVGTFTPFAPIYSCIEAYSEGVSNGTNIGIRGIAGATSSGMSFGLVGELYSVDGAAVYGSSFPILAVPSVVGSYAGYFDGQVYATEEITAPVIYTNAFLGSAADQGTIISTMTAAADVQNTNTVSSCLSALNAYTINPMQSVVMTTYGSETDDNEKKVSETLAAYNSRQHYALSADEMQEVFPELVYENTDGTQSINYMELIPILVQAINDLQAEIDELKGVRSPSRPMQAPVQTTGLNTTNTTESSSATRYDLQGRGVKSETKNSVIIHNGQKTIVK